jgi:hypothetical protein
MLKRGKLFRVFLFLLFGILFGTLVNAAQVYINSDNFYSGETFIAKISGNFTKEIKQSNIYFLKDDLEVSVPFYLLRLSQQEYLVYVNLPANAGNYKFAVKDILYYEFGALTGQDLEHEFILKEAVSSYYLSLEKKSFSDSIENLALQTTALFNSNTPKYNQGKQLILSKVSSAGCWPSTGCSIKESSLALIALHKSNSQTEKMKNWFLDAKNDLSIGLWDISLDSGAAGSCNLEINSKNSMFNVSAGNNKISLDTKDLDEKETANFILTCNVNFENPKIIHTYLGIVHEFPLILSGSKYVLNLDNRKCFGTGYRTECDSESTAYALLTLDSFGLEGKKTAEWLEKNAKDNFQRAAAYLFTKTNSVKSYLENNQASNGYWPKNSLAESSIADNKASVIVSYALKNNAGQYWIKTNLKLFNDNDLALALFLLLPNPENVVAVNPVYFKAKTNTTVVINIENKGAKLINVSASFYPFNEKKEILLNKGENKQISFLVPSEIKNFWMNKEIEENVNANITLSYTRDDKEVKFYNLEALIIPSNIEEQVNLSEGQFVFSPKNMTLTLLEGQKIDLNLRLKDNSLYLLENISFIFSRDLYGIANITPNKIDFINAGAEKEIVLSLSALKNKNYSGYIEARADKGNALFNITIIVTTNISNVDIGNNTLFVNKTNKTCPDKFGKGVNCIKVGMICKDRNVTTMLNESGGGLIECCYSGCIKKNSSTSKILGFIMIVVVLLILFVYFAGKMKKPKQEMHDVISDVENKYSRTYKNRDLSQR